MSLESGTQLGPYRVLEAIGAGGMGEVHKATDTRLGRTVAIKVLPPRFSEDAEMKHRFEREARTVAALNHPHICTLYDVGRQDDIDFLVMEFLEGETLAQRLERGPLPSDEALEIAIQIADALDKAHGQGVTHRDLKPGNVMLTEGGAKLLDFGLSKLAQPETGLGMGSSDVASTVPSTLPGTVLGTVPYMAPEQLEGNDAGPRTDIFAFGAVLYEMLTGKRAFEGKSQALLIAAIVSTDPAPLSEAVPGVSPSLDFLVRRCLVKDPDERIQTVSEVLSLLRWVQGGGEEVADRAPAGKPDRALRWGLVAALILLAVLIPSALGYFLDSDSRQPTVFLIDVPDMPVPESLAVSPDGRMTAYAARSGGTTALFLRPTDVLRPQRVAGSEGAERPFWSPDSQWVGFFANGQLKQVNVDGSAPPRPVVETADFLGGAWNVAGVILFASSEGLWRVPAGGGDAVALGLAASEEPRAPWFLPDGEQFLFLAGSGDDSALYAGALGSDQAEPVLAVNSNGIYVEPGLLLYHRNGTLFADGFDPGSLSVSGDARRIAEGVPYSEAGTGAFSASQSGVLAYRSTPAEPDAPDGIATNDIVLTGLDWVNRSGNFVQALGQEDAWLGVDLAPDGARVAVHRHEPEGGDVWVFEPGLELPQKLTFEVSQENSSPIWSPDGRYVAFASERNGQWGLYIRLADNTGPDIRLLEPAGLPLIPMSWVGDVLVYTTRTAQTANDIWYVRVSGEEAVGEPVSFLADPADERTPQLSPDGRWIAYSSNHTGRSEIYVRPFPDGPGLVQISTDGGVFPRWGGDSRQLYFMNLISVGAMMGVDLSVTGSGIRKDRDPQILFQTGYFLGQHRGGYAHAYAVSRDGQRFLIPQRNPAAPFGTEFATLVPYAATTVDADRHASIGSSQGSTVPIHVVLNWTAMLGE